MQDLGHPIVGDGRYGLEEVNPIGRLALHAFSNYASITRLQEIDAV